MTLSTNTSSPATTGFIGRLLGFRLRLAQMRVFAAFSEAVGDPAMTQLLAGTLVLIDENPGINQSDLAALLAADPSTMVRLIDQLERRGWVVRETAVHDRRQTVPRITPAGADTVVQLLERIAASEDAATAGLSPEERAELSRLLGVLGEKAVAANPVG